MGSAMGTTVTVRLNDELARTLDRLARQSRRTRSEMMREMLRRHSALQAFRDARERIVPLAEQAGYFIDEDVFRDFP
jgi:predicted transcriptional regulator